MAEIDLKASEAASQKYRDLRTKLGAMSQTVLSAMEMSRVRDQEAMARHIAELRAHLLDLEEMMRS